MLTMRNVAFIRSTEDTHSYWRYRFPPKCHNSGPRAVFFLASPCPTSARRSMVKRRMRDCDNPCDYNPSSNNLSTVII